MDDKSDEYRKGWKAYYDGEDLDTGIDPEWENGWLSAYDNDQSHQNCDDESVGG